MTQTSNVAGQWADEHSPLNHYKRKADPMNETLNEPHFRPLPLGAIRPQGWLARQLRIQADGLSGHLDEFWPDVQRSRWFGGDAEGLGARPLLAGRR